MQSIFIITTYVLYLGITLAMTVWVARMLHKNGRVFLVDSFDGNEALADSVNQLLVVGFYLINIGFVTMALESGSAVYTVARMIEVTSSKVGVAMLVLGCMHFFNLYIFSRLRRRAMLHKAPPPVEPQATVPGSEAAWREIAPEPRHA